MGPQGHRFMSIHIDRHQLLTAGRPVVQDYRNLFSQSSVGALKCFPVFTLIGDAETHIPALAQVPVHLIFIILLVEGQEPLPFNDDVWHGSWTPGVCRAEI